MMIKHNITKLTLCQSHRRSIIDYIVLVAIECWKSTADGIGISYHMESNFPDEVHKFRSLCT